MQLRDEQLLFAHEIKSSCGAFRASVPGGNVRAAAARLGKSPLLRQIS